MSTHRCNVCMKLLTDQRVGLQLIGIASLHSHAHHSLGGVSCYAEVYLAYAELCMKETKEPHEDCGQPTKASTTAVGPRH